MRKRPRSITIIAWILIVLNVADFLITTLALCLPEFQKALGQSAAFTPSRLVLAYLNMAITLLCASFLLRAANWARWLYIAWAAILLVFSVVTSPNYLGVILGVFFSILIDGTIIYFLLRPAANAYFRGRVDRPLPPQE